MIVNHRLLCIVASIVMLHLMIVTAEPIRTRAIGTSQQSTAYDCAADILFVVDATSSVAHYYERHRQYVLDVIGQLSVTPSGHNVGVIVYSSARRQQIRIPFGIHSNNDELITAVKQLPFFAGITASGAALVLAKKALESRRPNMLTNVIVITDGFSYDEVAAPAADLRAMDNVRVFAVGISEPIRESELLVIAGDADRVLRGADSASTLAQKLAKCDQGIAPPPAPAPVREVDGTPSPIESETKKTPCIKTQFCACGQTENSVPAPAAPSSIIEPAQVAVANTTAAVPSSGKCVFDVLFVVDASGSLQARFAKQLEISAQIVDRLIIGETNAHVALIRYAGRNKAKMLFDFNDHTDKEELKQAILKVQFLGGTTATNEALLLASTELDRQRTTRANAEPIVVVFTDGFSQETPLPGAGKLREKGVTVYAIGINERFPVSHTELVDIAGDEKRVFTEKTIGDFQNELDRLTRDCHVTK